MSEKIPHMETIKKTAKLTGLSEYFVRSKVLSGEIVSVRIGNKYLVNVDKFIEYLNTHTEDADAVLGQENAAGITPIPVVLR